MSLEFEDLQYGDKVELANGDTCVYVRKVIDETGGMIMQELNLVNIYTGEEHNINCYKDDLTHDTNAKLSVKTVISDNKGVNIRELVEITHSNAKEKGFWDDWDSISWEDGLPTTLDIDELYNNAIATRLMLIVSEVSEALEALRKDDTDNFAEELADVVIRVCDLVGGLEIDLEKEILNKIERNKSREYKHGKKF